MNRNIKIILGISLILTGLFWILNELGITIINYSGFVKAVEYLWPVTLIAIGLTMLFPGKTIKIIVWTTFIALLLAGSIFATQNTIKKHHNNYYYDNHIDNYLDM